jgi:hypothetical protein
LWRYCRKAEIIRYSCSRRWWNRSTRRCSLRRILRKEVVFEDDEAEEQPQLYDGVLLEVDADGDIVIPPVVEAALEPDTVEEEELMLQEMIQMIQEMGTRMRMKMKKLKILI